MRRIIYILGIISLSIISCSKMGEDVVDNEFTVEYRVSCNHVTRSIGEGGAVNYVAYAVYLLQEGGYRHVSTYQPVAFNGGDAVCPVVLAKDQTYKIVFVAQHYETLDKPSYAVNFRDKKLEMPQTAIANSENYDLFYKVSDIVEYKGQQPEPVLLDRIVAQVNLFSQETSNVASASGKNPTHSAIKLLGVPNYFDLFTSNVSGSVNVDYNISDIPGGNHLAYAYCLADGSADLEVRLYNTVDDNEPSVISSTDIPVERNKKTNINCAIL